MKNISLFQVKREQCLNEGRIGSILLQREEQDQIISSIDFSLKREDKKTPPIFPSLHLQFLSKRSKNDIAGVAQPM